MRRLWFGAVAVVWGATSACAFELPEDEVAAQFVTSNVVSTFYHEVGHALIDVLALPVLGREEDAADTLSTLLIHDIWEEESAAEMVYYNASAFLLYAAESEGGGYDTPYWDEHSLDMQRYYNMVCLFYGANPDDREDIARDLELPDGRAEGCQDEYNQAEASWGGFLEDLTPTKRSKGFRLVDADPDDPVVAMIADEIDSLNEVYGLSVWIDVKVEPCGQANAFYFSSEEQITLCTEYAEDLVRVWDEN